MPEVVTFNPVGPEDVQPSEQETDYINHVFMNQNPGFLVLYSFLKDALLEKVGIVKVWWEEREQEHRETYYDKTDDEYALIVSNPDVEVIEHTEHEAEAGMASAGGIPGAGSAPGLPGGQDNAQLPGMAGTQQPGQLANGILAQPQKLHDITVVMKKTHAHARVLGVPPEDLGIERGARKMLRKLPDKPGK